MPAVLLRSLGNVDSALAGDLAEEYEAGRSRSWYWRQVLALTLQVAARHKWSTLAGLAIAVAIHYVIGYPTAEFINLLNLWLTPRVPAWFLDYDLHRLWDLAFRFLVAHLLGIVITALQPARQRVPVLLAFVVYLSVWNMQSLPLMIGRGASATAMFLLWQVPSLGAQVAGVLLGGIAFWNPERRHQ